MGASSDLEKLDLFKEDALELPSDMIRERLRRTLLYRETGRVIHSRGVLLEAVLPGAAVGSVVRLGRFGRPSVLAEVVGFENNRVLLMPLEDFRGVSSSSQVTLVSREAAVKVGYSLLGKVLDGNGKPMDGSVLSGDLQERSLYQESPKAMERPLIREAMPFGVKAIDGLLTCGKGQRIGIMSGAGVGKSTLMGMIARNSSSQVNVIALIGERGRELREFIENDLGEEGLKRSVVVCATSDQSALLRIRAAYLATTIAEYFRDQGNDVVFMMDSVTRFSMAQREISLSSGEPPTSRGYTPSVFSVLPKLLERAGNNRYGSITGIYTVLVDGDDIDDPIADAVRSIIDGHIVLSRDLAMKNQYPAIDILQSISRVMPQVTSEDHQKIAGLIREWLATYKETEDLIQVGAYVKGANPKVDEAVEAMPLIEQFLKQSVSDRIDFEGAQQMMMKVIHAIRSGSETS